MPEPMSVIKIVGCDFPPRTLTALKRLWTET